MAFRKSFKRRPTFRRRTRRRGLRMKRLVPIGGRMSRIKSLLTHRYKRRTLLYGDGGAVNVLITTGSGLGTGYAGIGFNNYLTQIPQYTELTALYDYYKINYVVYKVTWISTNVSAIESADTSVGAPILYWYIDRDDVSPHASSAAGLNEMRAVSSCKRFAFTPDRRQCTIKFKPNTLSTQYVSGLASAYAIDYRKWIDCNNSEIPYWGTKMMFHTPSPTGSPTRANYFEIEATYYMSFKQPR